MLPWYCNMCRRGAKDNMLIYQVVVIVGQLLSWNYAFDIFESDPFSPSPLKILNSSSIV